MSKVVGPLLSIGARGQIAHSQVYATWRGIKYARRYVIPANPQTTGQMETRNTFSAAQQMFKFMQSDARAPWQAAVKGRPFFDRNYFARRYILDLRGQTDNSLIEMSPGAAGGIPLSSLTASTGTATGEINATATPPAVPTGWALAGVTFTAVPLADPIVVQTVPVPEMLVTTSPFAADFTGLVAATAYVISAWPVWTKPDGSSAYGTSTNAQATSGA